MSGVWTLMILDDPDIPGTVNYRDITPERLPLGKIFTKAAKTSGLSWTVAASHELLEMLVNPRLNLSVLEQIDNHNGMLYIYEVMK